MATYETILTIFAPIEATFAFVSDFRNAARWDPRTYRVEKATEGPIGVGTRFILTGGVLREETARRLHLPESVAGMPLPYDVTEFEPPNYFTLDGETGVVRYHDRIEFEPDGAGTRLRYYAELEMKGVLKIGEPLLRMMFKRIGDEATRGIPDAVAAESA